MIGNASMIVLHFYLLPSYLHLLGEGECKKHLSYLLHDEKMWEKIDLFSCITLRIFI
jgi:hypothetical protein